MPSVYRLALPALCLSLILPCAFSVEAADPAPAATDKPAEEKPAERQPLLERSQEEAAALQRKLLLYGVLGAIVLRTIFIFIGAWFVQEFSWILYIFGAFLVYTGFKFLRGQHEEDSNIEDMAILKWLRKHMRITPQLQGDKFFVRQNGLLWATPLFLVLILVEASDVIFAVDSIPAIFAVTTDPFIVLTANLMAILGLRAMFFLLSGAASKMHYLPYGLGIILVFIGFKMLMLDVFHMPIWISLSFIGIVLTVTAILSIRHSKKYNETTL